MSTTNHVMAVFIRPDGHPRALGPYSRLLVGSQNVCTVEDEDPLTLAVKVDGLWQLNDGLDEGKYDLMIALPVDADAVPREVEERIRREEGGEE